MRGELRQVPRRPALAAGVLLYALLLPTLSAQIDPARYGFSPAASGLANAAALQKALDHAGAVTVTQPGTYKLARTVYIPSNTTLTFAPNVRIQKVVEEKPFTHVLLNRGALTKTWDEHIRVSGLHIVVNNVDVREWQVYGLHGQLAFFYIRDLKIDNFRLFDGGRIQYAIHVCTFEDIHIEDVQIKGGKDGIHLGRGRRFTLRNGTFETGDDAIALNAHDYSVGNPELGWIEDGVIENMHDLPNPARQIGYFARILAGAWIDWRPGMQVQQSDTVVSNGRLYRVQSQPDGKVYTSATRPTHTTGSQTLDGIPWGVVQDDVTYTAGVRNVVFRDIFLSKPRTAFSIHFDNDKYSRSFYPGASTPRQENILLENVRVLYSEPTAFLSIRTPIDVLTIANSTLRNNRIQFLSNQAMNDYGPTRINMTGCVFAHSGELTWIVNRAPGKQITLKTAASVELSPGFVARLDPGPGQITSDSDISGLRKQ